MTNSASTQRQEKNQKSPGAGVQDLGEVPFGRQVPFSLAGFIVLAAYKMPVRGTFLNGSELRPREVASLTWPCCVRIYMYFRGLSRTKVYKVYTTYMYRAVFKL